MKRLLFLATVVLWVVLLAACRKSTTVDSEVPSAEDSITVVSLNYVDLVESTNFVVLEQTDADATLEIEKSFLETLGVSEINVANVVTVWEKITVLPFYIRVEEVEDLGTTYKVWGETVDVSAALCGLEDYDFTLNTIPYYEAVPNLEAVLTAAKSYGGNATRTAQLTDASGELHPAAMYCDPQYLYLINSTTADTIQADAVDAAEMLTFEDDEDKVVVDLSEDLDVPVDGEKTWRYSIIFSKDLSFKYPTTEAEQSEGYLETAVSVRTELGAKVYVKTSWWGELQEFQTGLFGNYNIKASVGVKFAMSKTFGDEKYVELMSLPTFDFVFWAGPIPIAIDVEPSLVRKVSAEVTGSLSVTLPFEFSGDFEAMARWRKDEGFDVVTGFNHSELWPSYNTAGIQAAVKVEANAGIFIKGAVHLYKVVGPTVVVGPNMNIEGTASLTNLVFLKVGLEGKAQVNASVGGEIKFWKWTLGSFDFPFTLWEATLFSWSWETNLAGDDQVAASAPLYQIPSVLD